jgi:RNA polymerase sigma-70 factor (ECF subfamily)
MLEPTGDAEARLMARVAAGDRAAFSALAATLVRPGLGLALRVLGDRALAEDAVQDALVKLWREAHRFDPARGSLAGWWRRILMNCALDGRRRLRPADDLEAARDVADPAPGPADTAETAALAARVQAAMAGLPARQRAALALFHAEGLTMAEIGEVLETSEKAVEGLLLRARATLRERLADLKDELG